MDNVFAARGRLILRPFRDEDGPYLFRWLNDPEVLQFYEGRDNPQTMESIARHYLAHPGNPVHGLMILVDEKESGYLQCYPLDQESQQHYALSHDQRIYGMDIFIGETGLWNQGIGTQAISLATDTLVAHYDADAVVVDPRADNFRAIHVYEKCGFHIVRRLIQEEKHEGHWHDCWLMCYAPSKSDAPSRSG